MDGDERMTLEEFLVDLERHKAVGVVAEKRDEFGGGVQNGLDLHLGDFGVGDGHTDRAVTEHRVLFLFQAAVVREELMERRVEQTDGMPHADYVGVFVGAVLFRYAQYARPSALCPAGIRAFAPGYVLDRCAVCAHTPGGFYIYMQHKTNYY